MKPNALMWIPCLLLALAASTAARAEDIDLFSGKQAVAKPNLLIIIDNTANWDASFTAPSSPQNCGSSSNTRTKFCSVKTALYKAIAAISASDTDPKFSVGLMLFQPNGSSPNTAVAPVTNQTQQAEGGYVRYAMTPMTNAAKTDLLRVIDSLDISKDKSPGSSQNGMSLEEARRYFGGLPVLNGNNTYWRSDNLKVLDLNATNATHTVYKSPATDACAANFLVFLSNGPPTGSDDGPSATQLTAFNGGTLPARLPFPTGVPSQSQSNWMDEYARLMFQSDNVAGLDGNQPILTFGIAIRDVSSGSPDDNASPTSGRYLVKNAALQGGGKYWETTSATQLQNALTRLFKEIQGVNDVFVSATLPVALNISNTYLNQVYMGLFRPDALLSPRWYGNLKEYKLAYDADAQLVTLVDRRDRDVVSSVTGFIVPTATSLWTHNPTRDDSWGSGSVNFWTNSMRGSPTPTATDSPDGEVVEKGGVAQAVREVYLTRAAIAGTAGSTDRKVLTCTLSSSCAATCSGTPAKFDLTSITASNGACQAKFGTSATADTQTLVNWIRGIDNKGDEPGPGKTDLDRTVTVRGSVHGDVLHSRPLIVNYGGSTGIVAYYGGNDGMLHAVCVGAEGDGCAGSSNAGQELWTFIAPDTYGKFKRLRDQSPAVWYPNIDYTDFSPAPQRRDYFFDGGIGVYRTSTRTVLYVAARRGGNFIYAIDVTNPTSPSLFWKIDNTTADFTNLGQTWSTPQVGYVRAKGMSNPVLFFGAGYCGGYSGSAGAPYFRPTGVGEDSDAAATSDPSCPTSANGRGIYVVDLGSNATATTPTRLKFFEAPSNDAASIGNSVAADVTLLDRDADGYVDRVYAADTGGTVWRMDVDDASIANWKLFKFAVARQTAAGSGNREKFLFRPYVLPTSSFDAVLIGSGNREDPLSLTTSNNFYMYKDFKTGKDASASPAMAPITDYGTMQNAATASSTDLQNATLNPSVSGWYYPLLTDGEKVVNAPLAIAGTVYFATNRPNAALPPTLACSNLGEARAYRLNFASGVKAAATANTMFTGGGLPPSPTAGLVQIGETLVPFCIGCGPGDPPAGVPAGGASPIDPIKIFVSPPPIRRKTFWYSITDQ
jgi:type IV pilus assembly protein PilY1